MSRLPRPSRCWSMFSWSLALGAATLAACNSSTSNEVASGNDAASGSSEGGLGAVINGGGGPCTLPAQRTTVAKLTLSSSWPATIADLTGTGDVSILLLMSYGVDSHGGITGRLKTCGNQTPPLTLSPFATSAVGAPDGSQVAITIPSSVWNAPTMPSTPFTGTLGGSNIGSSFGVDPVVTLSGLKPDSQWASASTAWPGPFVSTSQAMSGPVIPASDITDDDGDGKPGIAALPRGDMGFFVPRVALSMTAPQTDKLYVVLRTELSLYGTSTSCTDGAGTATVSLLNNHVIGCHIPDVDGGAGTDCDPGQYNFIDSNSTAYQVMSGTYLSKQLTSGTGDGGAVTCDDARGAFP